jgi:hypothetical protein
MDHPVDQELVLELQLVDQQLVALSQQYLESSVLLQNSISLPQTPAILQQVAQLQQFHEQTKADLVRSGQEMAILKPTLRNQLHPRVDMLLARFPPPIIIEPEWDDQFEMDQEQERIARGWYNLRYNVFHYNKNVPAMFRNSLNKKLTNEVFRIYRYFGEQMNYNNFYLQLLEVGIPLHPMYMKNGDGYLIEYTDGQMELFYNFDRLVYTYNPAGTDQIELVFFDKVNGAWSDPKPPINVNRIRNIYSFLGSMNDWINRRNHQILTKQIMEEYKFFRMP